MPPNEKPSGDQMNRTRKWTVVFAGTSAGILLTACTGETPKSEIVAPPPAAVVPASDTVIYTEPFSSPSGQAWLNSRYSMSEYFKDDDELAWKNVANDPNDPEDSYRIIESGCTNTYGLPTHCHLKVIEVTPGDSKPIRTLKVAPGSKAKTYNIEIRTQGENEQTELMTCKDVKEVGGNDQRIEGDCDIYPVRLDDKLNPAHKFCAHTERDLNKEVVIWFEYGHGACSETSGPIHNGTGHTRGRKK
jgi:hypothetical protein